MRNPLALERASVLRRVGRFRVEVETGSGVLPVHVANSGRIEELLMPGSPALLRHASNPARQTAYDLVLVCVDGNWISADASLPNTLVKEALLADRIPSLRGYTDLRTEPRVGGSRVDLLLTGPGGRCWVEVKSVTLVEDGVALFPDAPSSRAVRQLRDLEDAASRGDKAGVIFVVQRADANALRPNDAVDVVFGKALREAVTGGLFVLAYRCRVSPEAIELADEIPVVL
jgi:sugar fermentation stimulation protein A